MYAHSANLGSDHGLTPLGVKRCSLSSECSPSACRAACRRIALHARSPRHAQGRRRSSTSPITNPTCAGIDYPVDLLAALSSPDGLKYTPEPFGLPSARARRRRRLRQARRDCRSPPHRAHGKHQRSLHAALQAALRAAGRRRARADAELPAVRSPDDARWRESGAVPPGVSRPLDARRGRARPCLDRRRPCRAGRQPEQPHRFDRVRRRASGAVGSLRPPSRRAHRRRSVRRLSDRRGEGCARALRRRRHA